MNEKDRIDYSKLLKSLARLEEQYQNYLQLDKKDYFSDLDKEAIKESVIQRFETCYDTIWKFLKKYLEVELGFPEVPNSPKPIFRIAFENNLIEDAEPWFAYGQARIDTSHDYSESKAMDALQKIADFLEDSKILMNKIIKD